MASKLGVVIPDAHAQPNYHNRRFDYLGKLLYDVRPDFTVFGGDWWDFPSLCYYDKYKKAEFGERRYQSDLECGLDAKERTWHQYKRNKKKLPYRIELKGNHEHRIHRAVVSDPVLLEGTLGTKDLQMNRWCDEFVDYDGDTPGITEYQKILFAHYFVSGVSGRPLSSESPASEFIKKKHKSCVGFHDHRADFSISAVGSATDKKASKVMGLLAGCFLDYRPEFAGQSVELWWPGVIIMHGVEDGVYDPEFVSMKRLKETYG
jgi:hypothetical protein